MKRVEIHYPLKHNGHLSPCGVIQIQYQLQAIPILPQPSSATHLLLRGSTKTPSPATSCLQLPPVCLPQRFAGEPFFFFGTGARERRCWPGERARSSPASAAANGRPASGRLDQRRAASKDTRRKQRGERDAGGQFFLKPPPQKKTDPEMSSSAGNDPKAGERFGRKTNGQQSPGRPSDLPAPFAPNNLFFFFLKHLKVSRGSSELLRGRYWQRCVNYASLW